MNFVGQFEWNSDELARACKRIHTCSTNSQQQQQQQLTIINAFVHSNKRTNWPIGIGGQTALLAVQLDTHKMAPARTAQHKQYAHTVQTVREMCGRKMAAFASYARAAHTQFHLRTSNGAGQNAPLNLELAQIPGHLFPDGLAHVAAHSAPRDCVHLAI